MALEAGPLNIFLQKMKMFNLKNQIWKCLIFYCFRHFAKIKKCFAMSLNIFIPVLGLCVYFAAPLGESLVGVAGRRGVGGVQKALMELAAEDTRREPRHETG